MVEDRAASPERWDGNVMGFMDKSTYQIYQRLKILIVLFLEKLSRKKSLSICYSVYLSMSFMAAEAPTALALH